MRFIRFRGLGNRIAVLKLRSSSNPRFALPDVGVFTVDKKQVISRLIEEGVRAGLCGQSLQDFVLTNAQEHTESRPLGEKRPVFALVVGSGPRCDVRFGDIVAVNLVGDAKTPGVVYRRLASDFPDIGAQGKVVYTTGLDAHHPIIHAEGSDPVHLLHEESALFHFGNLFDEEND